MAIIGLVTLVVAILGLIVWLALTGFAKGTIAEAAKICFAAGLLAWLMTQAGSCSMGTNGVSTSTSTHR